MDPMTNSKRQTTSKTKKSYNFAHKYAKHKEPKTSRPKHTDQSHPRFCQPRDHLQPHEPISFPDDSHLNSQAPGRNKTKKEMTQRRTAQSTNQKVCSLKQTQIQQPANPHPTKPLVMRTIQPTTIHQRRRKISSGPIRHSLFLLIESTCIKTKMHIM